jgi:hypothetical protein
MDSVSTLSALIESKLAELASKQAQVSNAYEYEKNFDEWWTALGKEVFQANVSQPAAGYPKKRSLPNSVK